MVERGGDGMKKSFLSLKGCSVIKKWERFLVCFQSL